MTTGPWESFRNIKEMADQSNDLAIAQKVDLILSSAMEAIADMLPTATADELRAGAAAARDALEAYDRVEGVDELSPSFVAGRLASAVDVLGYASYQTADEAILGLARTQPFGDILTALMDSPMRSVDLARKLGKDEARTSKWLATLRENGAVISHKHGRELVSALTPVGRLVVEAGWQDERRTPLSQSNVFDLSAARYNLGARPAPADVDACGALPRISASGG
ncbi:MAG TPA: winged helix-turn-helix domain-containing protein [Sphingobium sp.]|uniref:winged helix-turn-helix domain-containing protein n=1 Tax=Sphingobium sp. TaxID=1912891 RepID=UPI002ED36C7D